MTLAEIVSKIRTRVKEYTDDSLFEDAFFWGEFLDQRAKFIGQRLTKHRFLSDVNYSTFCMDTQEDLSHLCGCKTVGCKVYRTIHKLPDYMSGRNKSTIELYTLDYNRIDLTNERDIKLNDLHPIKTNRPYASLNNGYAILWNVSYPAILVRMVASDPMEIMERQSCKEDTPCVNIYEQDIHVDRDIIEAAVDEIVKNIRDSLQITSDMNNDSNSEIKT